jgi:creatinine amidohydrolase/Fe(II)-dependent formamide hydrolase-like protein
MSFENSSWLWMDLAKPSPLHLGEIWWSSFSKTGVAGDNTRATAEKGQALFARATQKFIQLIREFRARELPVREDFH